MELAIYIISIAFVVVVATTLTIKLGNASETTNGGSSSYSKNTSRHWVKLSLYYTISFIVLMIFLLYVLAEFKA